MTSDHLQNKLNTIKKVFNVDLLILNKDDRSDNIAKYYKKNKLAYYIFHNKLDFIHMGISDEKTYSEKDLYKQADIIQEYINSATKNVLEIGCGKGKNIEYLAKKNTNIHFYGVDLKKGQAESSLKRSHGLGNMEFQYGDFHDLSMFKNAPFDLVFAIESLCHSSNKLKVAKEVHRVLDKNGIFIIFDGYLSMTENDLSDTEKQACVLVEKGMSVDHFEQYDLVKNIFIENGFTMIKETDYSKNILPTLYKFELLSKKFFKYPKFAGIINKLSSQEFTKNAISGYLMPDLINKGIAKYYFTVFKKV